MRVALDTPDNECVKSDKSRNGLTELIVFPFEGLILPRVFPR